MAQYNIGRRARKNKLERHGLLDFEAEAISGAYPTFYRTDFTKHDPSVYIRRMMKSRRQTHINLYRYGYSIREIEDYIYKHYADMGWLYRNGAPNPFAMLEYYRQKSMDYGEYFPKARRHGRGKGRSLSRGDVKAQKARAKARKQKGEISFEDYDRGRMR